MTTTTTSPRRAVAGRGDRDARRALRLVLAGIESGEVTASGRLVAEVTRALDGPGSAELLSVDQAARRLSVCGATVRRLIASDALACVRVGRMLRVPAAAVDALAGSGLLSVDEAAQRLGLSARVVYRLVADGELAAVRVRRALRIPAAVVDTYGAGRHPVNVAG